MWTKISPNQANAVSKKTCLVRVELRVWTRITYAWMQWLETVQSLTSDLRFINLMLCFFGSVSTLSPSKEPSAKPCQSSRVTYGTCPGAKGWLWSTESDVSGWIWPQGPQPSVCWMCTFGLTLPETNSLPLNIGHPKRKFIFQPLILGCNVSFTEWIQLLFRSRGVSLNRQFCFEFPNHFNKKTQAENGWWFRNPAPVDMMNIYNVLHKYPMIYQGLS